MTTRGHTGRGGCKRIQIYLSVQMEPRWQVVLQEVGEHLLRFYIYGIFSTIK